MVFPTFFNLNLNLAKRSSWSEPQSAPGLVFADGIELLHFWLQKYNQSDFGIVHLVMSMCRVVSCVIPRNFSYWKVLGLKTNFPTCRDSKGTQNTQGIWLWRPVGLDYRISTELGKQTLRGHKQPFAHQGPGERSSVPTRDWARLPCECPRVFHGGVGRQWPAAWPGHLIQQHGPKFFWRRSPFSSLPPP